MNVINYSGATSALPNFEMVETATELTSLCNTIETKELVALDTEFVRESSR
jgi:hypothetical protein